MTFVGKAKKVKSWKTRYRGGKKSDFMIFFGFLVFGCRSFLALVSLYGLTGGTPERAPARERSILSLSRRKKERKRGGERTFCGRRPPSLLL